MPKYYNIKGLNKKKDSRFHFTGMYREVFGQPTTHGIWLIYGEEKHGKTTLALKLAENFSKYEKTLYISGEEGLDGDFIDAIKRANVQEVSNRLTFCEFLELDDLEKMLGQKRGPRVFFFDNLTVYKEILQRGKLRELQLKYPKKLFVFLAHSDGKEPDNAVGKLAKRLAKVIGRVEGLTAFFSGRIPGGTIKIDEKKAMLYHGDAIK